jgi:hypothetical protein
MGVGAISIGPARLSVAFGHNVGSAPGGAPKSADWSKLLAKHKVGQGGVDFHSTISGRHAGLVPLHPELLSL